MEWRCVYVCVCVCVWGGGGGGGVRDWMLLSCRNWRIWSPQLRVCRVLGSFGMTILVWLVGMVITDGSGIRVSWRRGWWWWWKVVIFKAGEAYDDGCHPVYSSGVVYVPSDNLPFLLSLCWLGSIFVGFVCTFRLRVCFSFYLKCTFRFFVTSILFHLGHLLCLESSFWGLCVLI